MSKKNKSKDFSSYSPPTKIVKINEEVFFEIRGISSKMFTVLANNHRQIVNIVLSNVDLESEDFNIKITQIIDNFPDIVNLLISMCVVNHDLDPLELGEKLEFNHTVDCCEAIYQLTVGETSQKDWLAYLKKLEAAILVAMNTVQQKEK